MKQGHIHVHTSKVKRASGHSAVNAAAYQSGQRLKHEQQLQATIPLEAGQSVTQKVLLGLLHEQGKMPADEKKKNPLSALSQEATVEKHGRRDWTVSDGDQQFTVRLTEKKEINPETGKRHTVGRQLDVYADQQHGITTREDVLTTWLQTPHAAQEITYDLTAKQREGVWNGVEHSEVNRDAVTAIKLELSYLRDLPLATNIEITQQFIREQFTTENYLVDAAVHQKEASDGGFNAHVHLLVATRPLTAAGTFAEDKESLWNQGLNAPELTTHFRHAWAALQNEQLKHLGLAVQVDPRSYKDQGLDKEPEVHMGATMSNIEKRQAERGEPQDTLIGNHNRAVQERNRLRDAARQKWEALGDAVRHRFQFFKTVYQTVSTRFGDVKDRFSKDKTAPDRDKEQDVQAEKQRPQVPRPRSREEREVLARFAPYMRAQQWESSRDKAHFIVRSMEAQQQLEQRQRREAFDRIAGKHQGVVRQRAIHQDRPLPQERERERERKRQQDQQRRAAGRSGHGK